MTIYGLWQRQLFVFVFVILGGILWDLNPASGGQWRAAWEIGTVAALLLGAVQVLRSRLILTPDRVHYVGLVRSWSMPADQLVAIELRSTRFEMGNGAGGGGGFPVFRDQRGRWHRCPMTAFRTSERASQRAETICSYMRGHGHTIEITSLYTV